MTGSLHTGRLVLAPSDPFFLPPDTDSILSRLRKMKFCGNPLTDLDGKGYLLGERFMQLINFIGCSPYVQLEPTADNRPFCHLIIDGPYPRPRFLQGRNKAFPRCSNCRKRIPQWETHIAEWSEAAETYQSKCPHCGHQQSPANYDWRQSAGCGYLFLFVENIFPNEAIPSPELLNALQTCSKNSPVWNFFYIQD